MTGASTSPPTEEQRAATAFYENLTAEHHGWHTSAGALHRHGEHWKIVVELTRGTEHRTLDAYVWSRSRRGQMDPETAGIIAAAVLVERIDFRISPTNQ